MDATLKTNFNKRCSYRILQEGTIMLKPDGRRDRSLMHQCSSVLIWPEGEPPSVNNTVLTDPCFTHQGFQKAVGCLKTLGMTFNKIGQIFITHPHPDHCLHLPTGTPPLSLRCFRLGEPVSMPYVSIIPCPGHSPDMEALAFRVSSGECVWVVGDAVLDEEWLRHWRCYWPNIYSSKEIMQTWKSIAMIIGNADVVVPGHGRQITVTVPLIEELLANFGKAAYSEKCKDVEDVLQRRLRILKTKERNQER